MSTPAPSPVATAATPEAVTGAPSPEAITETYVATWNETDPARRRLLRKDPSLSLEMTRGALRSGWGMLQALPAARRGVQGRLAILKLQV